MHIKDVKQRVLYFQGMIYYDLVIADTENNSMLIMSNDVHNWAFGLVVWFMLWVREVPNSIFGMTHFISSNNITNQLFLASFKIKLP